MLVLLVLRAFASGCTALTGVEAVSNGVPNFRQPKSRNAAATLAIMGGLTIVMFVGITALALVTNVHVAADPAQLVGAPDGYAQRPSSPRSPARCSATTRSGSTPCRRSPPRS